VVSITGIFSPSHFGKHNAIMIASFQPEIPKIPVSRWFAIICLILIGFIIALCLPKCEGEKIPVIDTTKKGVIQKQKLKADSLDKASDKTELVRIVYVDRWHKLKPRLELFSLSGE